jgi:hypothetical protein
MADSSRSSQEYRPVGSRQLESVNRLARLADNFYLRVDRYEDKGLREYSGPWSIQDRSVRDLDPSITIRRTSRDDEVAGRAWWSPVAYSAWQGHLSTAEWLRTAADLPSIEHCFSAQSPDGCKWFVLDTHLTWDQPAKPGRGKYDLPQRHLWYIIRSYLVRRADATKFFRWAKKQDFMGRWMPEPGDVYHVYHGEFYWAPAYRETISDYQSPDWIRGRSDRLPTDAMLTTMNYVHESSGFDCSVAETVHVKVPAGPLASGMRLRWTGVEGRYAGPDGRTVAFDPSVSESGPGALLMRQDALQAYLADNGFELFWTVLGEKILIGGNSGGQGGWLQVSGVYRLTKNGIVGHATPEYRQNVRPQPRTSRTK